ncbi:MAG: hypothetical protein ACI835_001095 [Planctomycetota bacterium]|jgi:hypothetical protein
MSKPAITNLALLIALASPAVGQSVSYPDFSNTAGLVLNGFASQAGTALRVTDSSAMATGSFFHDTPVSVSNGFDTTFTFMVDPLGGGGADGMAFVLHNDPRGALALGDTGSALAYGAYPTSAPGTGIVNSLVVEIDTWLSGSDLDTGDNTISIHTNGTGENAHHEDFSIGSIAPNTNMSDAQVHTLRILYNAGQLSVYLDDVNNPALTVAYDMSTGGTFINGGTVGGLSLINGSDAYVGFSAATGGVTESHDVLSWVLGSSELGTRYCVTSVNSTGGSAMIEGSGSPSVLTNDLTFTSQPIPNQPSVFLYAPTQVTQPFGNGFLCASGGVTTLPVVFGSSNAATQRIDLTTLPASAPISAGETWNFQHWFRDPTAGGSYHNLSDAISITFTP